MKGEVRLNSVRVLDFVRGGQLGSMRSGTTCAMSEEQSDGRSLITSRVTSLPTTMQSLQARIDSFKKSKRVKRYPTKPSSSTVSVKWPHPSGFEANANTLPEAGFFFNPSWDDRDSVTCFLCGKELSVWDESDDPFEIHYSKCQSSCAWAVVRCGLTEDLDDKGRCGKFTVNLSCTYSRTQLRIS